MKSMPQAISPFAILLTAMMLGVFSPTPAPAQNSESKTDARTVPIIDGGAGSCSADFIVNDGAGAPVYDAKIRVHIDYRFGGFHKLDLEVGTNAEGKARFTGIPEKTKRGLTYYATHADQQGSAFIDPASNCKAQMTITLQKKTE
jgi:hypothetical protein